MKTTSTPELLSFLGIDFYRYPNRKLGELCLEMGLQEEKVLQSFYFFDQNHRISLKELSNYPLPIIIQYLKHTHSLFIKEKLPYIARLIQNTSGKEDLKLIFPEFIEEFIKHIHAEEDTVFGYIEKLVQVDAKPTTNPVAELWKYRNESLYRIHQEHQDEDEMAGLKSIVEEERDSNLHWKVIVSEIRAFDREIMYHAQIENKILFPKALRLETQVKHKIHTLSKLN